MHMHTFLCDLYLCIFFPHLERSCFYHLNNSCILQSLTWARSPRPDIMRRWQLQTVTRPSVIQQDEGVGVMTATALRPRRHSSCRWRPHTSPEGRTSETRRHWWGFQSCSDTSRFLFPLIWLLVDGLKKLKHTKGLEKSGDRGNLSQWLKGYLYSSTSKPLTADRNRTRRSKEWFS